MSRYIHAKANNTDIKVDHSLFLNCLSIKKKNLKFY